MDDGMILDYIGKFFGSGFAADISKDVTKFLIAWWFVQKKISTHLSAIEGTLKILTINISKLADSMKEMENNHSTRLKKLESDVVDIRGDFNDRSISTQGLGRET